MADLTPMAALEQASQHLRAAVELLDLDGGAHIPEYYATIHRTLADIEKVSAIGRELATGYFADMVPTDEPVTLQGGGTATHKRTRIGNRRPDNDAFAGDLRRHLLDTLSGAGLTIGDAAVVLDAVQNVISFNVSNAKSSGCKALGMDKSEYYEEAGHYESRLVIQ